MTLGCLQIIILEFWFKRSTRGNGFGGGGGDAFDALFA